MDYKQSTDAAVTCSYNSKKPSNFSGDQNANSAPNQEDTKIQINSKSDEKNTEQYRPTISDMSHLFEQKHSKMDICELQSVENKTPIIEQCPYLKRLVHASYFYEGNRNNS